MRLGDVVQARPQNEPLSSNAATINGRVRLVYVAGNTPQHCRCEVGLLEDGRQSLAIVPFTNIIGAPETKLLSANDEKRVRAAML